MLLETSRVLRYCRNTEPLPDPIARKEVTMKRILYSLLTLMLLSSVVLSACGGQPSMETHPPDTSATDQEPAQPSATPNPNTATATIGPDGGTVTSIDGLVEFIIPEASVLEDVTVNLTLLDSDNENPSFVSPAYDVEVIGTPEQYGWLPMLSFPGASTLENPESLVFATNLTITGDFEAEGDAPSELQYWVPLTYSLGAVENPLLLPMWHFSPYRVINLTIGPVCEPTDEMLEPPATPEDMYYVGRVVIINDIYSERYSTLPPDYEETHNGKVRGFRYLDEAAGCDILVLHWYRPNGAAPTPTPDPGGGGWPPPGGGGWPPQQRPGLQINPPQEPCWVYLGYTVLFRWTQIFADLDFEKWLFETQGDVQFELGRDRQPPGFEVVYLFARKDCDDWDECTDDWCNPATGECVHDPIPDCTPSECYCTDDAVITSTGCTWDDANQCSGLHSACDYEGITPPYKSGQMCCWGSCCITITCP